MGRIYFPPQHLPDLLSETAGYKAGLSLSVSQLCDVFSGTQYPDVILAAEETGVRMRSEEYEECFYKLLHRIGYTEEEYGGFSLESARLFHKYKNTNLEVHQEVTELFMKMWPELLNQAKQASTKVINPTPYLTTAFERYGSLGLTMAEERIHIMDRASRLSPHSAPRYEEWKDILSLDGLFEGTNESPERGTYIDQRYINYLYQNPDKLIDMHWRKFEELTSEFFLREGYRVQMGAGGNDDGVDIRIWNSADAEENPPLCVVQCKRMKAKIEKVVVKGLYTDVIHYQAKHGLLVTTSELSPGARTTITSRGYPIEEVNSAGVKEWLKKLREVGTGIVRV